MPETFSFKMLDAIEQIDAQLWQSIIQSDYPFIQFAFLKALETSKAVCVATGWQSCHLLISQASKVIGVAPLYLKFHSYGEYVFDFQWAEAFQQTGGRYYPKLLTAIPFTPAAGQRIYFKQGVDKQQIYQQLIDYLSDYAQAQGVSSWHLLFCSQEESQAFKIAGLSQRLGIQYHWLNQNYACFDDFLAKLKPKKRKNIRRERKLLASQSIVIRRLLGKQISHQIWQDFYILYQSTYLKRSGHRGYLNQAFFDLIGSSMAAQTLLVVAFKDEQLIAASLFFYDKKTLYGRYWGATHEVEFLHFEPCYYQGIDFCIEQRLQRFDAGAQGEHKHPRGFVPQSTFSNHWFGEPRFADAVNKFTLTESLEIDKILGQINGCSPYRV